MSKHGEILEGLKIGRVNEGKLNEFESEVNKLTKEYMANLDKFMKGSKFKGKTSKQSAMFTTTYENSDKSKIVDVSGWHGNGKYGDMAVVMEVYLGGVFHPNFGDKDHLITVFEVKTSGNEEVSNQEEVNAYKDNLSKALQKIKDYINK